MSCSNCLLRRSSRSPDELSDLFASVQKVGSVLERHYKATALTVAVQDGPAAGQSVPHVHGARHPAAALTLQCMSCRGRLVTTILQVRHAGRTSTLAMRGLSHARTALA